MPSILESSGADLLVYGMGEQPLRGVFKLLKKGVPFSQLTTVRQTSYLRPTKKGLPKVTKWKDLKLFNHVEQESNKTFAVRIIHKIASNNCLINPPFQTITEKEIDGSFDLPYKRLPHPKYKKRGPKPAYEMIKFSVNIHRGCFGECSFCPISAHQEKFISSRSGKSILREADHVTEMPIFKRYISYLVGPSANMY